MIRTRRGLSLLLGIALLVVSLAGLPAAPVQGSASQASAIQLAVSARSTRDSVIFNLDGRAPPGATEVILW